MSSICFYRLEPRSAVSSLASSCLFKVLLSVYMIVESSCVHKGNPMPLKVQPPRGTNYCFKCHTLTGERPGLHSSFIAALCQMLLSISELTAQCALRSPADVHRSVCLLIPCMVMICTGLYASCAGTTPLILCLWHSLLQAHILLTGFTAGMNVSLINNKIHSSNYDTNGPLDYFSL